MGIEVDREVLWIEGDRNVVFVSFGGRGEGFGWEHRLRTMGVTALGFKDSRNRWYLDGADGFSSFEQTLEHAGSVMKQYPDAATIFLGQSFGAYAALRAAIALRPDHVLAFSPQTRHLIPRKIYHEQRDFLVPADAPDIRQRIVDRQHVSIAIIASKSEAENPPSSYFWDDHAHLEMLHGRPHIDIMIEDFHHHPSAWCLKSAGRLDSVFADHVARAVANRASSRQSIVSRN
jgi:hypothetical protein